MYRIKHISHHQTGDKWCIYPMYDFAHPIQDAIEGVTHSLCSLEYEAHRPLYDWVVNACEFEHKPRQIEFARLNLTNTIMSKRSPASAAKQSLFTKRTCAPLRSALPFAMASAVSLMSTAVTSQPFW